MRHAVAAVVAVAITALPASAHAVQAQLLGNELDLTDPAGAANSVEVTNVAAGVQVTDAVGVTLGSPAGGCSATSPQTIVCPDAPILSVVAELGAGDDAISFAEGFDSANAFVFGGPGRDSIDGSDTLDDLSGGPGRDRISGGNASDGITGGPGGDRMLGGDGNDELIGNSGNDRCDGAAGNDECSLGAGSDRCKGGSGQDDCLGGRGRDRCDGGSGGDGAFACEIERRIEKAIRF